jgi:tetratricopeptide (TPR) repeat protein
MRVAREVDDVPARAWAAVATGVLEAGLGNFAEAARFFEETATLGRALGDGRRCDDSAENEAAIAYLQGSFSTSLAVADRAFESARKRNDISMQVTALRQKAYCLLIENRLGEAAECVEELQRSSVESATKMDLLHVVVHPLLALIHWRRAEYEAAAREAEVGTRHLVGSAPMYYPTLLEHSSLAQVHLGLRERGFVETPSQSRAACKRLRSFARVFVVAQPAALLWSGLERWLSGKHARALADFTRAAAVARKLGMPYYEALAHYEVGRHQSAEDPSRGEQLVLAIEAFTKLGEGYYAALARAELGASEHLLPPGSVA